MKKPRALTGFLPAATICACLAFPAIFCEARPTTVLAPSNSVIEAKEPPRNAKKDAPPRNETPEVDILMSMMEPFDNIVLDMDMPQLFAFIRHPAEPGAKPERRDMLGEVEEIRYMDKKAWGANVALEKPGLYQFILDGRPWWNGKDGIFIQQQAKTLVPVLGVENGWNLPAGQSFEIVPMTRPFGLAAPALFTGKILLDGKPLENAPVYMGRLNAEKIKASNEWSKILEARSGANGEFSFVLNQPGWWHCEAVTGGAPLKGPDGQSKDLRRSAILWFYVDALPDAKGKR